MELSSLKVNEEEGEATVCVGLNGQLTQNIELSLTLITTGTASLRDFNNSTLLYTFVSGSNSTTLLCEAIDITRDNIVEGIEDFTVILRVVSPDQDVNITQDTATITITDSQLNSE